jgi:hypothetical protein
VNNAVAAESEFPDGFFFGAVVIDAHGGATIAGEPPGFLEHIAFEAAAADGTDAHAGFGEQHARAGTSVCAATDLDHSCEDCRGVVPNRFRPGGKDEPVVFHL